MLFPLLNKMPTVFFSLPMLCGLCEPKRAQRKASHHLFLTPLKFSRTLPNSLGPGMLLSEHLGFCPALKSVLLPPVGAVSAPSPDRKGTALEFLADTTSPNWKGIKPPAGATNSTLTRTNHDGQARGSLSFSRELCLAEGRPG